MDKIHTHHPSTASAQKNSMEHAEDVSGVAANEPLSRLADALIARELAAELGTGAMLDTVRQGHAATLAHLRNIAALEGRILEMLVAEIARTKSANLVLRGGICLPVSEAALELVELNSPDALAPLSLSADHATRRGYTPDLVIVDKATGAALIIDVKRTVSSYDATRLSALKTRMLAAGLALPDFLYREQNRLSVSRVDVAVLSMDDRKSDADQGIWPISRLDELLGVPGAADAVAYLRKSVSELTDQSWRSALAKLKSGTTEGGGKIAVAATGLGPLVKDEFELAPAEPVTPRTGISFGFARARPITAH